MKSIQTLPSIVGYGTCQFIFLSIVTIGVFPLMWLFNTQKRFLAEFNKVSWDPIFPLLLPTITGLLFLLSNFALMCNMPVLSAMFDLTDALALFALWTYWAFKMRSEIIMYVAKNYHFKLKINVVLLFFFSYFYIVYILNTLPREYELITALQKHVD